MCILPNGWLFPIIFIILWIIYIILRWKLKIAPNFWYTLIACYFFIISFLEVMGSGISLYAYDIGFALDWIPLPYWSREAIASMLFASVCSLTVLFPVYIIPKVMDKSKRGYPAMLCPRENKTSQIYESLSNIGNKAAFIAIIFLLIKYTYYLTATSTAVNSTYPNTVPGKAMDPTISLLVILYYVVIFFAIFLNVVISELEKNDFKLLLDFIESRPKELTISLISNIFLLLSYAFLLILGANAISLLGGISDNNTATYAQTYSSLIILAYFITMLSYLHLIYYRVFYISSHIKSFKYNNSPSGMCLARLNQHQ
jgi:hypothetical protein